jgi:hypothetical protein
MASNPLTREALDWSVEDSPANLLWQAAYHGGCARVMIRIIEQWRQPATLNLDKLENDCIRCARSGFRWAAAFLDALSDAPAERAQLLPGWSDQAVAALANEIRKPAERVEPRTHGYGCPHDGTPLPVDENCAHCCRHGWVAQAQGKDCPECYPGPPAAEAPRAEVARLVEAVGATGCPECDSGNRPHTLAHEEKP